MLAKAVFFWIFSISAVVLSIVFVTRRNPVHAALILVVDFVVLACLYVLLSSQFIAMAQIMVYAGAIMMFFIYIIMHIGLEAKKVEPWELPAFKVVGFIFAILIFFEFLFVSVKGEMFGLVGGMTPEKIERVGSIQAVAYLLYTKYVLAFEVISILLLAGIVAAVILAKKRGES